MPYAQIKNDSFVREFTAGQLVEWDTNNYCTAEALVKDGKADQFGVVFLTATNAPQHDPITQTVERDGAELVNGRWCYKWKVLDLSPEQVAVNQAAKAAADLAAAKAQRQTLVDAITVTTQSGKVFDGNEDAQRRMTSAIAAMDDGDELPWVLHDNTVAVVTRAELREALRLAGSEMAAVWIAPYTQG